MKIAFVQLGRIGDLVLFTSVIKPIKQKYPNAKLYFIVGQSNCSILYNNTDITKILVYDKNPLKLIPFLTKLKAIEFDYYIDPKDHFSNESYVLARFVKSKCKIGFNNETHKAFDISIDNDNENVNLHFVERIINTLKIIDIEKNETLPRPYIMLDNTSERIINSFLEKNNIKNHVMINISASHHDRMWNIEKWCELINYIKSKKTQLLLSSDTKHLDIAKSISEKTGITHLPASPLSIVSCAISKAKLLISPDTSLIHIAAAFDVPVISLTSNMHSNIIKFYPLSTKKEVVFPKENNQIVKDIELSAVIEAYNKLAQLIIDY